uniref:Uncharacterized protein n=1 Tax=Geospiza parvula TaxID=87175 RepID=A0A8C3Q4H2_GEOPR
AMRAAGRRTPAAAAGEPGSDVRGEQPREHGRPRSPASPGPPALSPREPRQKCVYVEPPRRVKEILEEHFHLQEEECNVNHPTAVALEGVWNVKNNFSIRSLKPVSQKNSDLLVQPQFYSRHARVKSKSQ